jgi:hypothetical protein
MCEIEEDAMKRNKQLVWIIVAMLLLSLTVSQAVIAPSPVVAISENNIAVSDKGMVKYGSFLTYTVYLPFVAKAPRYTFCFEVNEIPGAECDALVALYSSTNGDSWNNHTNWLVTDKPSSWYGVWVSGGHVGNIVLSANGLTGEIPPELGNLTAVTFLYFNHNQLSGSIPPELANLTALTTLNLSSNHLSGSIPAELANLTALTALHLEHNQLSGSIPHELGNMAALIGLFLGGNQLTGSIPAELANLTALTALHLEYNQLTGSIPVELGNIPLLELQLGGNQLIGNIPVELGNLTDLVLLDINGNQLTGSIPLTFTNLTRLARFYFYNTYLCEPDTPDYLVWKNTVLDYQGTGVICP